MTFKYIPRNDSWPNVMVTLGLRFPANQAVTVEDEKKAQKLRGNPYFEEVVESPHTTSLGENREALEAEARALGIDVDRRWSDKTLAEKIEAAKK